MTAYLDCSLTSTDADTAVGQFCLDLGCTGVTATAIRTPSGTGLEDPGRYGAVQMSLYGTLRTDFLNQMRTISIAHDDSGRRFEADETLQDFDDLDACTRRRIRDDPRPTCSRSTAPRSGVNPFDDGCCGRPDTGRSRHHRHTVAPGGTAVSPVGPGLVRDPLGAGDGVPD